MLLSLVTECNNSVYVFDNNIFFVLFRRSILLQSRISAHKPIEMLIDVFANNIFFVHFRRSILLQSRISAHKLIEMPIDAIQSVGSGLAVDSPMLQGSLDGLSSELISPNPSSYYDKTFIEIYMEKKRIKEEKDKEIAEEKKRSRETRRHGKRTKKKARMATKVREKDGVNIGLISEMNNVMETTQCGIRDELVVKSLEKVYKSRSYHEGWSSFLCVFLSFF